MPTRDPFAPHKHAERVLREAKRRGFEVFVALDDRTSFEDTCRIRTLADQVVMVKSNGYPDYSSVTRCAEDFVLMLADDEEPSDLLWRFASEPPFPARFGIPVIPIKGRQFYSIDCGFQERVIYRQGWKWVGGYEGRSEGAKQVTLGSNPGVVVWHYDLDAPREEREEKARSYARLADEHGQIPAGQYAEVEAKCLRRLLWEDHPELLRDLPATLAAHLPKEEAWRN
jgi:hypothetical protein